MSKEVEQVREIFLNERPAQILLELNQNESTYIEKIRDNVNTTSAHITKVIRRFHEQGLINKKKEGRKNMLTLTRKGRDYKQIIKKFYHEPKVEK